MITDAILAQACADIYPLDVQNWTPQAGQWDHCLSIEDICFALRKTPDGWILAFPGSFSEHDWLKDFQAWPRKHPKLGYCHSGFLESMDAVVATIVPIIGSDPVYITGHSLGGARTLIAGGLLTVQGLAPKQMITFGTPRPGMQQLSTILNTSGAFIKHYRNGLDPVPEVPLTLAPLWLYQKPQPDTMLRVAPPEIDEPLHWHHMPLYLQGILTQVGIA